MHGGMRLDDLGNFIVCSFDENDKWQRQFWPIIPRILAEFQVEHVNLASRTEDMKYAIDLKMAGYNIALRIRSPDWKGRDDVTIRAFNYNAFVKGHKVEFDKIKKSSKNGPDIYLYIWANTYYYVKDLNKYEYIIYDIKKARDAGIFDEVNLDRDLILNKDGDTGFISIKLDKLRECGAILKEKING